MRAQTYNLYLAQRAIEYANRIAPESSTHPRTNTYPRVKQTQIREQIQHTRAIYSASKCGQCAANDHQRLINSPRFYALQQNLDLLENTGIANCLELSRLACDFIARRDPTTIAEPFHIIGGDHEFVVIGRNPDSNPSNPKTWGKECIVCDPWSQTAYPASQIHRRLRDYTRTVGADPVSGRLTYLRITQRFDPSSQALQVDQQEISAQRQRDYQQAYSTDMVDSFNAEIHAILKSQNTLLKTLQSIGERADYQSTTLTDNHLETAITSLASEVQINQSLLRDEYAKKCQQTCTDFRDLRSSLRARLAQCQTYPLNRLAKRVTSKPDTPTESIIVGVLNCHKTISGFMAREAGQSNPVATADPSHNNPPWINHLTHRLQIYAQRRQHPLNPFRRALNRIEDIRGTSKKSEKVQAALELVALAQGEKSAYDQFDNASASTESRQRAELYIQHSSESNKSALFQAISGTRLPGKVTRSAHNRHRHIVNLIGEIKQYKRMTAVQYDKNNPSQSRVTDNTTKPTK